MLEETDDSATTTSL